MRNKGRSTAYGLNKARLAQINEALAASFFTAAGYSVVSPPSGETIVHIELKDYPQYSIELRQETPFENVLAAISSERRSTVRKPELVVMESPSDFLASDRISISDFDEFLRRLILWVNRVKNEVLLTDTIQGQLSKFYDDLSVAIEEHIKDPNVHFSPEEQEGLRQRLQELEERVAELGATNQLTKEKLDQIQAFLREMQKGTETMTKRSWMRTFASRAAGFGVQVIGRWLLEGHFKDLEGPIRGLLGPHGG